MKKLKIYNFFNELGFDVESMEYNRFYPVSDWEILSFDSNTNEQLWKDVTHVVRKESCVPVITTVRDSVFFVSPEHRFYCRVKDNDPQWIEAVDLIHEGSAYLFSSLGEWELASFEAGDEEIEILDLSVKDTECYYSHDYLSHNTLYGDPTVTPGGAAIPFHSSVRIKLGAGSQIENDKKEIIGINVSAKTVKNKVAPPFRSCNFQIHFGKGIVEHEEVFDVLRGHGEEKIKNHTVKVSGDGAWKLFEVVKSDGTKLIEKKFHKTDFNELLNNTEYKPWLDDLIEAAMVKIAVKAEDIEIDPDSYEEVRSVADLLGPDSFVSPE